MPSMSGSTPHRSSATAGVLVSRECSPDPLIDTCAVDTFRATFVRRRPSTGPSMSVRSTCDAPSRAHAMPGRPEMPLPSSTTHLPTRDDDRFRSMYFARRREASQQVVPPGARACVRGERGAGAGSFRSTYVQFREWASWAMRMCVPTSSSSTRLVSLPVPDAHALPFHRSKSIVEFDLKLAV